MSTLRQLKPAQCSDGLSFVEFRQRWQDYQRRGWVAEPKWDGRRYLLHTGPPNYLTSRRVSVQTNRYVEQQDKLPVVRDTVWPQSVRDCVFDGELVAAAGGTSNEAATALKNQQVLYWAFDVLFWEGIDLRERPWWVRRTYLGKLNEAVQQTIPWLRIARPNSRLWALFQAVRVGEGEGLILKDPEAPYGQGWVKVKAADTHDCVCIGYTWSTEGRFAAKGWIRGVLLGQWVDTRILKESLPVNLQPITQRGPLLLVAVGATSGFTDQERQYISEHTEQLLGEPLEVEAQLRFPKTWHLRHPRFVRWRSDKPVMECLVRP